MQHKFELLRSHHQKGIITGSELLAKSLDIVSQFCVFSGEMTTPRSEFEITQAAALLGQHLSLVFPINQT